MSKQNNLTDFLTDVADAIRTKKGTQALIDPQDFSDEIASIQTGGNNPLQDMLDRRSDTDGRSLFAAGQASAPTLFRSMTAEDLEALNFSRKHFTTANRMFSNCVGLTTIPVIDFSGVTDATYMFSECENITSLPMLDFSSLTTAEYMFRYCEKLTTIPAFNFSNVTDGYYLFNNCTKLTTVPQLNFSKLKTSAYMFYWCTHLTSIPQLNLSTVNNANSMFYSCRSLTAVPQLDLGNVTSSGGTAQMFRDCPLLTKLDFLKINVFGEGFAYGDTNLSTLIIRTPTVASLSSTNAFDRTPIKTGTGYIYVPDNLVNDYKTATN